MSMTGMTIMSVDVAIMTTNRTMIIKIMVMGIAWRIIVIMMAIWLLMSMIERIMMTYLESSVPVMPIPVMCSTMWTIVVGMVVVATMMIVGGAVMMRSCVMVRSGMMTTINVI